MRKVWFGTRDHMQWIEPPAVDVAAGKQGYSAQASFTNGGAWVRRSKSGAKLYSFSWNMKNRESVQPVLDYADGVYGDGYIYYSNPFAMNRNVLPQYWATPAINCYDGPVVIGGNRPVLINNGMSINGFPVESAQYTVTSTADVPEIYIPIPPTHTAFIGVHGSLVSGNANVVANAYTTATGSTPTNLTLLNRTTLTNHTVNGATYRGVGISMVSASVGVLQLDGLIVQVLPTGAVAPSGGFISGQGQSGMQFVNSPVVSEYNAALDRVGVSADLIETEAWA